MTKKTLGGLKVVVTRPKAQAESLAEHIAFAGGEAISFPVIEILPVSMDKWADVNAADYNMLIFVSRNAVEHFIKQWPHQIPEQIQMVAVGAATARCMEKNGMRVNAYPDSNAGSETLLTLPLLQCVSGRKILIIRGYGGRELLAETLKDRGAAVDYLEVYHRVLPHPSQLSLKAALEADCAVITSIAGLENFCKLLVSGITQLKTKPLLVISERIRQHAIISGFKRVIFTVDASDNAVVKQLFTMGIDDEQ